MKQDIKLKGRYHVQVHEGITKKSNPFKWRASSALRGIKKHLGLNSKFVNDLIIKTSRGKFKRSYDLENLIPTVGLTAFAAQMSGDNTTDVGDNLYIAVGSDATDPAIGDTTLGTEVARKAAGSTSFSGAVASIAVFFAATEATGTHREFGLFGNGNAATASGAADSGVLFSHVAANVTVAATETLTITFQLTFS